MTVVDIHTHMYPPTYVAMLESRRSIPLVRAFPSAPEPRLILLESGARSLKRAKADAAAASPGRPLTSHYTSLDQKMHFMDTYRIDVSVLSLANP